MKSEVDLSFYDRLMERSYRLESIEVESGYLDTKIHKTSGLPIGTLAAIHNNGSIKANIPSRPFMILAAYYWAREANVFSKAFVDFCLKRKSINESFNPVGRKGMRSVQTAIMSQQFVPLATSTIEKKGSSTILFDTGELINSVKWRVGMK
jgi:hypothetical protein